MRILDIALKDLRQSFRSASALGMMLVAPLLIAGLIYWAFGGLQTSTGVYDFPPLDVALVNLDQPPASAPNLGQTVVDMFADERMPKWLRVTQMADEETARAAVRNRESGAAIIVPVDLSAALMSGGAGTIAIVHDPTLTIGPAVLKDVVDQFLDGVQGTGIALSVLQDETSGVQPPDQASALALARRYGEWYGDLQQELRHGGDPQVAFVAPTFGDATANGNSAVSIIGPIMAGMLIFFVFNTAATGAQSILREEEDGTLQRLFTTATPRATILGGKLLAVLLTVVVQSSVLLAVSRLAFAIDWGQPASLLLAVAGLSLAASAFGLMLIAFIRSTRQAGPVLGGVLTVTGMLGGLFTVGTDMPAAFQTIGIALPQGWALQSWRLLLAGAGASDLLTPVAVLLSMAAAFFAVGLWRLNRRYA